jgi:hypothetical protein
MGLMSEIIWDSYYNPTWDYLLNIPMAKKKGG